MKSSRKALKLRSKPEEAALRKIRGEGILIIDPEKKQIEQYLLENQTLHLQTTFDESDLLNSSILNGFSVELSEVFED